MATNSHPKSPWLSENGVVSSSSVSVKDSFPALNFPANVLLFSFDTMKVMKLYEEGNGEKR